MSLTMASHGSDSLLLLLEQLLHLPLRPRLILYGVLLFFALLVLLLLVGVSERETPLVLHSQAVGSWHTIDVLLNQLDMVCRLLPA